MDWKVKFFVILFCVAKIIPLLGFILLIPSVLLNIYFFKNQSKNEQHEVLRVIDGDTFETKEFVTIRLLSVNAPELDTCGGQEAKKELEKLILSKKVAYTSVVTDDFKRVVADVFLADKTSVNLSMIKSGWTAYRGGSAAEREAMKKVDEENQKVGKGIYGPECSQDFNPLNPTCNIKGNTDQNGNKRYYVPGCDRYNATVVNLSFKDQWFCSETNAKAAGFVRAQNCPE